MIKSKNRTAFPSLLIKRVGLLGPGQLEMLQEAAGSRADRWAASLWVFLCLVGLQVHSVGACTLSYKLGKEENRCTFLSCIHD